MIEIKPLTELDATAKAPPSKAHTLRALFVAGLASGKSTLENPLFAEDQLLAAGGMEKFGAEIQRKNDRFEITGVDGAPAAPSEPVFLGNSGVSIRFACSIAALADGRTVLAGSERMKQRPLGELISGLGQLGVKANYLEKEGFPPVEISGPSLKGGKATMGGEESSQYFSSILVAAPYAEKDVELLVRNAMSSAPYVGITIDVMEKFGAKAENDNYKSFFVEAGQRYRGRGYSIEGDFSNASYFFAAAAVSGGSVRVSNLGRDSKQPDKKILELLEKMGCSVKWKGGAAEVEGPEKLKPVDADMNECPDIVPTVAVVAAFAGGKSVLRNVGHLKIKESDRMVVVCEELGKMGIKAYEQAGALIVEGGRPKGAVIYSHDDHRIAMAFAVAGLKAGVKIEGAAAVGKSFPDFFERLGELGK